MKSFRGDRGVTLIELVIVLAIVCILAAIAIPAYVGSQKNAERQEAYTNLQNLRLLEEQLLAENGETTSQIATYPATIGIAGQNQPGNIALIQNGNGDATNALPSFNPGIGTTLKFSYQILQGQQIVIPVAKPPTYAAVAAGTPCYAIVATGNPNSRVTGEVYAIDCYNTRNF
ncbi:MAG: prepilin-type N-terminal cleavage/methylation domain-containing protein [Thermodesulfovibrionales bacterium]